MTPTLKFWLGFCSASGMWLFIILSDHTNGVYDTTATFCIFSIGAILSLGGIACFVFGLFGRDC